ncbi:MAG: hypothetical protein ABIV94_12150 [Acidimicrobiales bacterium]
MADEQKSIAQVLRELWELLVTYGKQETLGPLKGLGRFIGWGIVGSVMTSIGVVLLTLAGLRAMQTHTGEHLTGNLRWVPYAPALVLLGALIALTVSVIKPKGSKR